MFQDNTFTCAAERAFASIERLASQANPRAKCRTTQRRGEASATVVLSALEGPSDDAAELELEYREAEGTPWLEGTLYQGQRTVATVALAGVADIAMASELDALVGFLLPRFIHLLSEPSPAAC